mgnify:CR=1 FL=1
MIEMNERVVVIRVGEDLPAALLGRKGIVSGVSIIKDTIHTVTVIFSQTEEYSMFPTELEVIQ